MTLATGRILKYFRKSHRNRLNLAISSDLMYSFQISLKKTLQRNKILGHFLLGLRQGLFS